uniref:Mitotic spindle organizing protein 1 n=2 Tax=Oncorhynchus TaxID=8016 RepID=A0A8C7IDJ6_ONCKI|nr:mitotic-spindle organizing protein 1 [Oncorhynchus nerka]
MASSANANNMNAVRETMDVLLEISRLLNTGLDMESLSICVRLCEQGINPEALSSVIKELRKASDSLKVRPCSGDRDRYLQNGVNRDTIEQGCPHF